MTSPTPTVKPPKTASFLVLATTPFGKFHIAVESTEQDARLDASSAVYAEFDLAPGQFRISPARPCSRHLRRKMFPVKNAYQNGETWAWVSRKVDASSAKEWANFVALVNANPGIVGMVEGGEE